MTRICLSIVLFSRLSFANCDLFEITRDLTLRNQYTELNRMKFDATYHNILTLLELGIQPKLENYNTSAETAIAYFTAMGSYFPSKTSGSAIVNLLFARPENLDANGLRLREATIAYFEPRKPLFKQIKKKVARFVMDRLGMNSTMGMWGFEKLYNVLRQAEIYGDLLVKGKPGIAEKMVDYVRLSKTHSIRTDLVVQDTLLRENLFTNLRRAGQLNLTIKGHVAAFFRRNFQRIMDTVLIVATKFDSRWASPYLGFSKVGLFRRGNLIKAYREVRAEAELKKLLYGKNFEPDLLYNHLIQRLQQKLKYPMFGRELFYRIRVAIYGWSAKVIVSTIFIGMGVINTAERIAEVPPSQKEAQRKREDAEQRARNDGHRLWRERHIRMETETPIVFYERRFNLKVSEERKKSILAHCYEVMPYSSKFDKPENREERRRKAAEHNKKLDFYTDLYIKKHNIKNKHLQDVIRRFHESFHQNYWVTKLEVLEASYKENK